MEGKNISRRRILTLWRRPAAPPVPTVPPPPPAAWLLHGRKSYLAEPAIPSQGAAALNLLVVRPPGAQREEQFLNVCQRCGRCVETCPVQAIRPLAEGPSMGTPYIDTRLSPCQLCEGLKCTHVCPSGALIPLEDPRAVRMGTAVIDSGQCLAYRGAPCRACVDVCPVPGVLNFAPGKRVYVPVAGTEACIGCGLCHQACPLPAAIRIFPLNGAEVIPVRIEPISQLPDRPGNETST